MGRPMPICSSDGRGLLPRSMPERIPMTTSIPTRALLAFLVMASVAICQDSPASRGSPASREIPKDAIAREVSAAVAAYREALAKAKAAMLAEFAAADRRLDGNTRIGIDEKVRKGEELAKAKRLFESTGRLPSNEDLQPATTAYRKAVAEARARCDAALTGLAERAWKTDREQAKAILEQKDSLLGPAPEPPKPDPPKVEAPKPPSISNSLRKLDRLIDTHHDYLKSHGALSSYLTEVKVACGAMAAERSPENNVKLKSAIDTALGRSRKLEVDSKATDADRQHAQEITKALEELKKEMLKS
jgi:hypothetical protein